MYKVAVIGSGQTMLGFKALGLDVFPAVDAESARKALRICTHTGGEMEYAIIYMEESLAEQLRPEIDKFKDSPSPAIIVIPGAGGSTGMGQAALHAAVERAVGSDILK